MPQMQDRHHEKGYALKRWSRLVGCIAAAAMADGNTLLLISNGTAVTANLFNKIPFDVLRDFTPISTLGFFDLAILTSGASSIKSLPDLLADAKANPRCAAQLARIGCAG
jgi:tripartite-type tricarboxylate transporter receptor subunit TctC